MNKNKKPNKSKEPVTIRLDNEVKKKLHDLAQAEDRTMSSLIDSAVRNFLNHRQPSIEEIKIHHAALPDTSILRAFHTLAPDRYTEIINKLDLPPLHFEDTPIEWRRLLPNIQEGESDVMESLNWQSIFLENKQRGCSAPQFDWVAPYLYLFTGHCVFIRQDHVKKYLENNEINDFLEFREKAVTGKDLSLRSIIAWINSKPDTEKTDLYNKILNAWRDTLICCQLGTDYEIAIKRVLPILVSHINGNTENLIPPIIQGVDSLDNGFKQFHTGTITTFIGSFFHSAKLLDKNNSTAFLIAGPSDLRIPSLNTLAGKKGMLDGEQGKSILALWRQAVIWFREDIVMNDSNEALEKFIALTFINSQNKNPTLSPENLAILKSLMQTWSRWFADPEEAEAFLGFNPSNNSDNLSENLVKHYEALCKNLNSTNSMPAPNLNDKEEHILWRFPVFDMTKKTKVKNNAPKI